MTRSWWSEPQYKPYEHVWSNTWIHLKVISPNASISPWAVTEPFCIQPGKANANDSCTFLCRHFHICFLRGLRQKTIKLRDAPEEPQSAGSPLVISYKCNSSGWFLLFHRGHPTRSTHLVTSALRTDFKTSDLFPIAAFYKSNNNSIFNSINLNCQICFVIMLSYITYFNVTSVYNGGGTPLNKLSDFKLVTF